VLAQARPMSLALFGLMSEGVGTGPEQRAGLRTRLEAAASRVADRAMASELRRSLLDQFFASRPMSQRPAFTSRGGRQPAQRSWPAIPRPVPGPETARDERARALVAILLNHPHLLPELEEAFAAIDLPPALASLRTAILQWSSDTDMLDSEALITHLTQTGLEALAFQALSAVPVPLPACAAKAVMPAEAASGWWHFFGLLEPDRLESEIAAAERDFKANFDAAGERRLTALVQARNELRAGGHGSDLGFAT
jgi:DNA primase